MNVIVVDTSSWISYFKGKEVPDLDLALKESRVYLPPVVAAELLSSKLSSRDAKFLQEFLIELHYCNAEISHWFKVGELRSKFSKKGIKISTPDAHVAQCAIDLEGYLLSEDKVFKQVSQVVKLKLLPN